MLTERMYVVQIIEKVGMTRNNHEPEANLIVFLVINKI